MIITDWKGDKYLNPDWPANKRAVNTITKIIVHHDAVNRPTVYDDKTRYTNEAREHYNRLGPGLQYHYKVSNLGDVYSIRPHDLILWHAGNLDVNKHSIAICVDGNFENQVPTKEQFASLKALLDNLCTQHPEFPADQNDVQGHREVSATACPGAHLRDWVTSYRTSGGNVEVPNVAYNDGHVEGAPVAPPVTPPVHVCPPCPPCVPTEKIVEKIVEKVVEKQVPVIQYVDKEKVVIRQPENLGEALMLCWDIIKSIKKNQ